MQRHSGPPRKLPEGTWVSKETGTTRVLLATAGAVQPHPDEDSMQPVEIALPASLDDLSSDPACRASLLEVLRVAEQLTGDPERAATLMRDESLRVFDGRTASQLVLQGRALDVIAYLESLDGGAAG